MKMQRFILTSCAPIVGAIALLLLTNGGPANGEGSWNTIYGTLKHVSVGEAWVWGVNAQDQIFRCKRPCTGAWSQVDGALKQVDVGDTVVWGVDANGQIRTRPADGSGATAGDPPTPDQDATTLDPDATTVLTLVNQHRAAGATCGGVSMPPVPQLRPHAGLNAAAAEWSQQMQEAYRLSHERFVERVNAVCPGPNSWAVGENVFGPGPISAQNVVARWMNSPGHCSNIMHPNAELIGIGRSSNSWWTLMFASGCQ
jgi:uncharacterized protein YkwD